MAIERWLDANYTYTLDLADPHGAEPIEFFLDTRKKGHCEYFASAFVVLARAAGIPARNVNGFYGGEWNEYEGRIAVRAGDAHAWAEVYFPGAGWVTFDPTPPARVDELGRGGTGVWARMRRLLDSVRFAWTKWVVEYDLFSQLSLFRTIGRAFKRGAGAVRDAGAWALRGAARHWPVPLAIGLLAGAVLVRRWRRRAGPAIAAARARRRPASPIAAAYAAVLARLARAGHPRDPATTPRELAATLGARGVPGAADLGELTELYYRAQWGGELGPEAVARAAALQKAIEDALTGHRASG